MFRNLQNLINKVEEILHTKKVCQKFINELFGVFAFNSIQLFYFITYSRKMYGGNDETWTSNSRNIQQWHETFQMFIASISRHLWQTGVTRKQNWKYLE